MNDLFFYFELYQVFTECSRTLLKHFLYLIFHAIFFTSYPDLSNNYSSVAFENEWKLSNYILK